MNEEKLKSIGDYCRNYRRSIGVSQKTVSEDIDYSPEVVSAFENGRNDNVRVLMWYLQNGINLRGLIRAWNIGE